MSGTILIVDDHPALLTSLRLLLETVFSGCRIIEANSGPAAITIASQQRPDIILMDIDMPQMSGLEVTRSIKTALPKTKIVMLTIYEDDPHRAEAARAGASAYVPKSRFETDLIPTLKSLLGTDTDQ